MQKNIQTQSTEQVLYRKPLVLEITGLSHSTLYYLMKKELFPKQVKIGERAVAWKKSDIDTWFSELNNHS